MELAEVLGRNIREARQRRGLSQEELAFSAGMKRSYVSDMERGLRNPTVRAIARLAAALAVEPASLLLAPSPTNAPNRD
jgi:transcriptional regulator with XRE-family HTH domain